MKRIILIFIIILIFFPNNLTAQFYNGHQLRFGKNRVQYNDFYWEYYRFDRFDTYFYLDGKKLSKYASKTINDEIKNVEDYFSTKLQRRIIFLIFNKQSEFKQSNIGLITGNELTNIGGSQKIIKNKVFIYYEGDHQKFVKQIRSAIIELMLNELLYGGNFVQQLSTSTLLNIPDWYFNGLVSYLTEKWSFELDNQTKDALDKKRLKKINHLNGDKAKYAGHAIWYFIAETYGDAVIPNILYLTRINKNIDAGFLYVLGANIKSLTPLWIDFYKTRYESDSETASLPANENIPVKSKKNRVYQQIKLSPDNKYIAYTSNYYGRHKVWLINQLTGKKKKLMRLEHRLEQITDYSYPVLAWHPSGKILAMIAEVKGRLTIYFYMLEKDEIVERYLPYFDKILDFSYSDRGIDMIFTAVLKGQTDIFVYNLSSGSSQQITNDASDKKNSKFIENSTKIIFSSNRISDTLIVDKDIKPNVSETFDLFIYDFKNKSDILKRVTNTPYINEFSPEGIKENTFTYLSDENGINNRILASYDSTISYIDTITHFRYYTNKYPISNYNRNINYYSLNPIDKSIAEILYNKERDRIYLTKDDKFEDLSKDFKSTLYRKEKTKELIKKEEVIANKLLQIQKQIEFRDSLALYKLIPHPDSLFIDVNYYIFEKEKENPYHIIYKTDSLDIIAQADSAKWPEQKIYRTSFYTDEMVTQIDFGFLNDSYQMYSPGAYYFNPGMNILTKIGITDMFEDFKITGGFRFSGNFDSFEYLLSAEDLKNRLDKQYIYHRLSVINYYENFIAVKFITNEAKYRLSYPFNQVSSVKSTTSLRSDRAVILSTSPITLPVEDFYYYMGGFKLEYIFDNTINVGINLYNGIRLKVFGEYYQEIQKNGFNTYVFGADFRYYLPIHRTLIFAGRIATSASYGSGKLLYYLGGVDNWLNFSLDVPTFDQSVRIDNTQNYVFQAVATDMRGFVQNARNGTKFFLMNAELRWPIVRYLANRPLNSTFFNNLQVVSFADLGSAWSGFSPWEKDNAYNTEIIEGNPVRVIIDKQRSPFVMGYGFGLRSQLFGYFVRADWAWGVDGNVILPRVFYFSLSLDF
ncbi:MAG: hypothetical protein JXR51_10305 [Bacteroidales bacterium]|nr:hypothetical protein [Bacteroidales bacterium]